MQIFVFKRHPHLPSTDEIQFSTRRQQLYTQRKKVGSYFFKVHLSWRGVWKSDEKMEKTEKSVERKKRKNRRIKIKNLIATEISWEKKSSLIKGTNYKHSRTSDFSSWRNLSTFKWFISFKLISNQTERFFIRPNAVNCGRKTCIFSLFSLNLSFQPTISRVHACRYTE